MFNMGCDVTYISRDLRKMEYSFSYFSQMSIKYGKSAVAYVIDTECPIITEGDIIYHVTALLCTPSENSKSVFLKKCFGVPLVFLYSSGTSQKGCLVTQ